jgi:hypothetical protein
MVSDLMADGWRLEQDRKGIRVYTRAVVKSDIRQFKAEVTLPVSMDTVLAVFDDFKRYPEWKFKVDVSDELDQPDALSWYHYQGQDLPFPASNRMFVLKSQLQVKDKNNVVIETHAAPDYCQMNKTPSCAAVKDFDALMVTVADGKTILRQQPNGSTRVTWIQHAEPGGSIPGWMINKMLVENPWETFNRLRRYVKTPRYAQAKLRRNAQGEPVGGFETVNW